MTEKHLVGCDEVGHIVGAKISSGLEQAARDLAIQMMKGTGFQRGVLHLEFKFVNNKAYLIEVAARVPGDNITALVESKYGINLEYCLACLYCGKTVRAYIEQAETKHGEFGIRYLYSDECIQATYDYTVAERVINAKDIPALPPKELRPLKRVGYEFYCNLGQTETGLV
ncbi:hypothetical protein CS022_24385 [Veronia nyctiphanis]|uniref:ATP-grasp domain-containing protein n=1 Tax=Veronia nyctiphanis TaxID=1278244 RepID=A0A4Q0YBS8_9GAMM|nr:hypothetical protein CS022_24385 [Veronia nyctiphanis]